MTNRFSRFLSRRRPPTENSANSTVHDGDRAKPRRQGQKVQAKELRELCELIRKRYSLDVEIWSFRHTRPRDRHIVEDKIKKSEAVLAKINRIVDSWDTEDAFESPKERAKLQEIRRRIKLDGKRDWAQHPPWSSS